MVSPSSDNFIERYNENETCKTIFALSGCILYQFQCIECTLSTLIAWKKLSPIKHAVDQTRWDSELIYLSENSTLGDLIYLLEKESWISVQLLNELKSFLDFRNFLILLKSSDIDKVAIQQTHS